MKSRRKIFLSGGLPQFDLVGLPDAAVKEARERVRASVKNCGLDFPVSRVTVNLAPADRKKAGTVYDLPILLGILIASGQARPLPPDAAVIGELSLLGRGAPGARRAPDGARRGKGGHPGAVRPCGQRARGGVRRPSHRLSRTYRPGAFGASRGREEDHSRRAAHAERGRAALPRLCRGEGTGKRQARARSRRRGRAQCAHGRAAGFGQIDARQASPRHTAGHEPRGDDGIHRYLERLRSDGRKAPHTAPAPLPRAAPHALRRRDGGRSAAPAGRGIARRTTACCFSTSCPSPAWGWRGASAARGPGRRGPSPARRRDRGLPPATFMLDARDEPLRNAAGTDSRAAAAGAAKSPSAPTTPRLVRPAHGPDRHHRQEVPRARLR